jgi:hypothetical protein
VYPASPCLPCEAEHEGRVRARRHPRAVGPVGLPGPRRDPACCSTARRRGSGSGGCPHRTALQHGHHGRRMCTMDTMDLLLLPTRTHARTHARQQQQTPAPTLTLTRTSRLTGGVDAPPPCRSCVRRANQPLQSQRGAKQSRVGRGGAEKPARTGDGLRRSECWRPPCASVRRHPSPRSGLHGAASLRA